MSGGRKVRRTTLPTPMSVNGWSLDEVLAGVRGGLDYKGTGHELMEVRQWREWDVGGFTGPCFSLWADDAHDLLVPSSAWHNVKWLRIAATALRHTMGWSTCERAPSYRDNFPAGALALLEWEAGRQLSVIGGALHIRAGLPPDLMEVYWEVQGKGSGYKPKTLQQLLQALEGGVA